MKKRQPSEAAKAALKKYQEDVKNGKIVPKRPTTADRLAKKRAKFDKLSKELEELQLEIIKLEKSADKKVRDSYINQLTTDELKALVLAKQAKK